jgi:hypothetical protein
MSKYGGFQGLQNFAFQSDYQTTFIPLLVVDPDYEIVRPYTYRFCSKTPEDDVVLTFNFSQVLAVGEIFVGNPSVTFSNLYGGDTNPSALLNGPVQIDTTGQLIMVPVLGGLDMNDYIVTVQCPTSNDFKGLGWPGLLPVRIYPNKIGAP